jgi:predicted nucleic acid-binding protein
MPPLLDLPAGVRVFIDANVLAYHFATAPSELQASVRNFLASIRPQRIQVFTSPMVVLEVVHRALVVEARREHNLATSFDAVNYLKQHPEAVKAIQARLPNIASDLFNRFSIRIEAVTYQHVHASRRIRLQHGLMASDSVIVAMMHDLKLPHLVTNDQDFARVPGITVWLP